MNKYSYKRKRTVYTDILQDQDDDDDDEDAVEDAFVRATANASKARVLRDISELNVSSPIST